MASWVVAFAARLICMGLLLLSAILFELGGVTLYNEAQLDALYAVVLAGFLVSLGFAAARLGGGETRWLTIGEIGTDGLLISALVYCTGGTGSLFGFLFVPWIVASATRIGARASVGAAGGATLAYGVVGLGGALGVLPTFADIPSPPTNEATTSFGLHVAAFLSVALLARRLEGQVEQGRTKLLELGILHQRIVDNVSSGLLTTNRRGEVNSFNRSAEEITGFSADEMLGFPLSEVLPVFAEASDTSVTREEHPLIRRDGSRLYLGFSRSVMRDPGNQPDGEIVIFRDLSQIREMEALLRRSERLSAVGQLATGMAHEIRNPLASLSGAIELLRRDLRTPDSTTRRLFRIVERETARLNRLVVDFLSYAGNRKAKRDLVDLKELLEEMRELYIAGRESDSQLQLEVQDPLIVLGDSDQLRQVFWNLILNAAQAEPVDDRVVVRARPSRSGDEVVVEVRDRGAGIPPELLERSLEPFFTTKPKGTGLGLATVHRVVEDHNGSMEIDSQVGHGTSVRIRLHRCSESSAFLVEPMPD